MLAVEAVKSTPTFFAKRLFHSLAGAGSKDRALIRVIVTRAECDLEDIKVKYEAKYGTSLKDAVTVSLSESGISVKKKLVLNLM